MRKPEPVKWWSKAEADALEAEIKDLESRLKYATSADEARSYQRDIEMLDRRLCEYFC